MSTDQAKAAVHQIKILDYLNDNNIEVVKQSGRYFTRCPMHDDRNPSMQVNDYTLYCYVCKETVDLIGYVMAANSISFLEALQLLCDQYGINFPAKSQPSRPPLRVAPKQPSKPPKGNIVKTTTYYYQDERGEDALRVTRYDLDSFKSDGKRHKTFKQHAMVNGSWQPHKGPCAPYRYREWKDSTAVFLVEGEKCADALASIGVANATTIPGGGKWPEEFNRFFVGRNVVVLPDEDEGGDKYLANVTKSLFEVTETLSTIQLPDLAEKEDVADWIDRGGTKAQLLAFKPKPVQKPEAPSVPGYVKLETFTQDLLPDSIWNWAEDCGARLNVCPTFVAIPLLVSISSVIGRKLAVCPRRHSTYFEIPNLWGMIIGRPSVKKTPGSEQGLQFIRNLSAEARDTYLEALPDWQAMETALQAEVDAAKRIFKNPKSTDEEKNRALMMLQRLYERMDEEKVVQVRHLVSDVTHAKLARIMGENENGVMVLHDELKGLLTRLNETANNDERMLYLEAWGGKGSKEVDRVTQESFFIKNLCLSLFGTMHPDSVKRMVADAVSGAKTTDDGMLNRFQLMVWPESPKFATLEYVDRKVDNEARERVEHIFEQLAGFSAAEMNIPDADKGAKLPFLKFSSGGYEVFAEWHDTFLRYVRESDELSPILESHYAKYESLVPKLALIFYLVDWADGNTAACGYIPERHVRQAIKFSHFLAKHAKKVFDTVDEKADPKVQKLLRAIDQGRVNSGMTLRKVQLACTFFKSRKELEKALETLTEHGVLKVGKETAKNGRLVDVVQLLP